MTTKLLTKEKIQEELVEFLCLQFYVDKEDIDPNESLVDTGIIDSMGLIEISAYITEKYSFSISTIQMTKDNFGSVEKITSFILSNINQK